MEISCKPVEIFNMVQSIVHRININNFDKMAKTIISIPKRTIYIFENIVDIIYFQALNRSNFAVLYAQLCAYMVNDGAFNTLHNSKATFQKVLAQKSFDDFTSYYSRTPQKEVHTLKEKFMNSNMTPYNFKNRLNNFHFQYYNRSLTHCKFIGELFKQGAFTEKNILSFIHELMKVKDILNIHCLCIILQIAGQKLSKVITKIVKY
uniref:Eukaryotic translation initiation factor 4 gamma 1 n=1 Tax=Sipha flava TaxID=143950 RepID=A0A2S2R138_9HEMI